MKEIIEKWGADALRDSDGTDLPEGAMDLAEKVYGINCSFEISSVTLSVIATNNKSLCYTAVSCT